jgi:hypothetical protein
VNIIDGSVEKLSKHYSDRQGDFGRSISTKSIYNEKKHTAHRYLHPISVATRYFDRAQSDELHIADEKIRDIDERQVEDSNIRCTFLDIQPIIDALAANLMQACLLLCILFFFLM